MSELKFVFKPGRARIRATFAHGEMDARQRFGEIDAEAGVLRGVQVNLMGEALGHGIWLDEDFIDSVVEQGNAAKRGVKVRFGHPGMCSDALGTFLGRARDFEKREVERPNGEKVWGAFADIHLAEEAKIAPNGDLYAWTLETARNNPDTFGQSIVFTYDDYYVIDEDGAKHKYSEEPDGADRYKEWKAKSADGRIYAVLGKLLGTDFTDSPAATDGVFSSDGLVAEVEQMLDEHPRVMDVLVEKPDTVAQFLERYNDALTAAGKQPVCLRTVSAEEDEEVGAEKLSTLLAETEKRLAGMQAAKDREIARLFKAGADVKKGFDERLAKLQADLDSALSELSVARGAREDAETALVQVREQLEAEQKARATLAGAVLASPDVFADFRAAQAELGYVEARRQYPDLYASYMERAGSREGA